MFSDTYIYVAIGVYDNVPLVLDVCAHSNSRRNPKDAVMVLAMDLKKISAPMAQYYL